MSINRIAVFCGSSPGNDPVFSQSAAQFGRLLASEGVELVYGGARVGLMGVLADAVLMGGGRVTGIIPDFLGSREIAHEHLTELVRVTTMHERKVMMYERSDGIMALPGGFGTLDEFFEILTWAQLGLHSHPIGLLNIAGFYDPLLSMVGQMVEKGFLLQENKDRILVDSDAATLLKKMKAYQAPDTTPWIRTENI